jgi:class 3 adenylate cyclase
MSTSIETHSREERKVITALCADLAGSTALSARLDPEDAREIIGGALARVIMVIEQLGGTIKDLAGDGVLALFGAPVSHEDDKERAVRAGLRIIGEVTRYAQEVTRDWGLEALAVRVGIESGLVVVGPVGAGERIEYGAVGDAVNTASPLCFSGST